MLLTVAATLLVPRWMVLTLCIPILMVMSVSEVLPEILSIGEADIQAYDIALLIVLYKVVCSLIFRKQPIYSCRVFTFIIIFIFVLLEATVIEYYRSGEEIFFGEMISLLRFIAQISVVFVLTYSINDQWQISMTEKIIEYLGYLVAITVYFNVIAVHLGFQFGEVQPAEGMIRYFGPIGDQVGFILLLFIYKQLIGGNVLGALFLGGAVVATGTVGAIGTLIVGLVIMAIHMHKETRLDRVIGIMAAVSFTGLFGLLFMLDFGSIQTRIIEGNVFQMSGIQRILTFKLAAQTFWENLFTGVGFTGFRYHAADFDAESVFIRGLSKFSPVYIASASNQFLQVATDGGLIALAAFSWLIITCLRTLRSTIQYTRDGLQELMRAGYVWLLSLVIGAHTAAWLLPGSLIGYLLWLILGVALAARRARSMESTS